jgi:serine/threonine-protein kinase
MGEVYLARDGRLGREVALKVLPEAVGRDPVRLARLEGEARILASLNHPGIAGIYGLEEDGGLPFLVLELIPGETLEEKLRRGALPIDEALTVCRQIARALEAAHERGIVHRDLKCANIKVTPGGAVKVLDFGLAKAFASEVGSDAELATRDLTVEGVVMGTAAYMSPEQATGQALDARTDVWSFGCVLYETLTGSRVFVGPTRSDVLAAVLHGEPDWDALPRRTPDEVRQLLRRCLQRDRNQRLHHIADARIQIEEALAGAPVWPRRRLLAGAALAVLLGAGAVALTRHTVITRAPLRPHPRLQVRLPPDLTANDFESGQTTLALSPDGRRLVFAAGSPGSRRLYSRLLEQLEAKPVAGTEGGDNPFFSPDGQWLGFESEGRLAKVPVAGGEPVVLCETPSLRGASWGDNGTIVFASTAWSGLSWVSAAGGPPQTLTTPVQPREISHRWPRILPGGREVVFSVMTASGREQERTIEVVSLDTHERRVVLHGGTYPIYAPSGHLLFAQADSLQAARFDLQRLQVTGSPVQVLEDVKVWSKSSGAAYVDVSADGTLAYTPGYPYRAARKLVRFDRAGGKTLLPVPPRAYGEPALSPDGHRLAVEIEGPTTDVWIYDLVRNTWSRLTFDADNGCPSWSPDGAFIAFTSTRNGARNVFRARADGSGSVETLTRSKNWQNIVTYAPDGRSLLFTEQTANSASDIWMLPLGSPGEEPREPRPVIATSAIELSPALSPDGRWLAYSSTESRKQEIYVRPYPSLGRKWPISTGGGAMPVWAPNGRELYYRNGKMVMAVRIQTSPDFVPGTPRPLFELPQTVAELLATFSVSPDGQSFYFIEGDEHETAPPQIVVVVDWLREVEAKVSSIP